MMAALGYQESECGKCQKRNGTGSNSGSVRSRSQKSTKESELDHKAGRRNPAIFREGEGRAEEPANPLAPREPHFKPTAKSVIWCFLDGGPSHIDLFDPKPELRRRQGQPLPPSFGMPVSQFTRGDTPLLGSTRNFRRSSSVSPATASSATPKPRRSER